MRFVLIETSVRADDKSLRRGAHKVKRVTGHQSQDCVIGIVEHSHVFGLDNLSRVHAIAVGSCNVVSMISSSCLIFRSPLKKRVPVSCECDIPTATWQRGSGYMPNPPSQSLIVGAFHNHHRKADCPDLNSSKS